MRSRIDEYKELTKKFLSNLGYDITKDINEQFLERHRNGLIDNPAPKKRKTGPKPKNKKISK